LPEVFSFRVICREASLDRAISLGMVLNETSGNPRFGLPIVHSISPRFPQLYRAVVLHLFVVPATLTFSLFSVSLRAAPYPPLWRSGRHSTTRIFTTAFLNFFSDFHGRYLLIAFPYLFLIPFHLPSMSYDSFLIALSFPLLSLLHALRPGRSLAVSSAYPRPQPPFHPNR